MRLIEFAPLAIFLSVIFGLFLLEDSLKINIPSWSIALSAFLAAYLSMDIIKEFRPELAKPAFQKWSLNKKILLNPFTITVMALAIIILIAYLLNQ